jgi:hypothetical protein
MEAEAEHVLDGASCQRARAGWMQVRRDGDPACPWHCARIARCVDVHPGIGGRDRLMATRKGERLDLLPAPCCRSPLDQARMRVPRPHRNLA